MPIDKMPNDHKRIGVISYSKDEFVRFVCRFLVDAPPIYMYHDKSEIFDMKNKKTYVRIVVENDLRGVIFHQIISSTMSYKNVIYLSLLEKSFLRVRKYNNTNGTSLPCSKP